MNCLEAIEKERRSVQQFCGSIAADQYELLGVSVENVVSVAALAVAFGLRADPKCYQETDAELARAILISILHRDLAYNMPIMPLDRAEELASRFLQEFGRPPCRFFTNGTFEQNPNWVGLFLRQGYNATEATFDTGILVLGPKQSACVWVADED